MQDTVTASASPWQNPFAERLIGSIRRECLDHVVVLNEQHLRRLLRGYFDYYHRWRCHRSLGMDAPDGRSLRPAMPSAVEEIPFASELHHCYVPMAA